MKTSASETGLRLNIQNNHIVAFLFFKYLSERMYTYIYIYIYIYTRMQLGYNNGLYYIADVSVLLENNEWRIFHILTNEDIRISYGIAFDFGFS